jgi:hypothetical protein
MTFTILLALSGLILSAVAIYYSVLGLTAIFAAAFWPIVVMGTTLEISKLVAASWLKAKWNQIPFFMKTYMMISVLILMLITSMGIFGFLSKAHSDQSLISGDVSARLILIDEKIKIERENITNAQTVIKQMDDAVNGIISSGDQQIKQRDGSVRTQSAAERSLQIRRSQAKDRATLTKQIEEAQGRIVKLQEESAPIRAEMRKVEAEVGPIKYIAKFIYGNDSDNNLLEKAVTWVIISIIFVFDPLAILMILASQMTYQWYREEKSKNVPVNEEEPKEELENNGKEKNDASTDDLHDNEHDNNKRNEPWIDRPETVLAESPRPNDTNELIEKTENEDPIEKWNEMIEAAEKAASEEKNSVTLEIKKEESKSLDDPSQRSERIYDPEEIQKILKAKADNVPDQDPSEPKKKLT